MLRRKRRVEAPPATSISALKMRSFEPADQTGRLMLPVARVAAVPAPPRVFTRSCRVPAPALSSR